MKTKIIATLIVLLHLFIVLAHGRAHVKLQVAATLWQNAFIAAVIVVCPLVAMTVLWTGLQKTGFVLLSVSMAGSLVFGLMNHFLLSSPDNALGMQHGYWRTIFGTTAILLAIIEAVGLGWPIWALHLESARE
jgi:hypothetical protein